MGMDGGLSGPCGRPGLPRGRARRQAAISTPSGSSRRFTSGPALALAVPLVAAVSLARPASPFMRREAAGWAGQSRRLGQRVPGLLVSRQAASLSAVEADTLCCIFYCKGWSLLNTNRDAE